MAKFESSKLLITDSHGHTHTLIHIHCLMYNLPDLTDSELVYKHLPHLAISVMVWFVLVQ